MHCVVCGGSLSDRRWSNYRGQSWCGEHAEMPTCKYCGAPTNQGFRGVPRCKVCGHKAIDRPEQVAPAFMPVRLALEARGMQVHTKVRLILRSTAKPAPTGPFSRVGTCGVTSTRTTSCGRVAGNILIVVAPGYPLASFESTMAHEWAHAFIADREHPPLSSELSEGFAQYIAHTYLTHDRKGIEAEHQAKLIEEHPDPVYGGGYHKVRRLARLYGPKTVFTAFETGQLQTLGLH